MPSSLSLPRYQQHDALRAHLALPAALLLSCTLALLGTSSRHSLLTSAIAWLSICTYTTLRIGAKSLLEASPSQKLGWAAGTLFALAGIEERSGSMEGVGRGKGFWWAKVIHARIIGERSSD